jgi:hypothetical protein
VCWSTGFGKRAYVSSCRRCRKRVYIVDKMFCTPRAIAPVGLFLPRTNALIVPPRRCFSQPFPRFCRRWSDLALGILSTPCSLQSPARFPPYSLRTLFTTSHGRHCLFAPPVCPALALPFSFQRCRLGLFSMVGSATALVMKMIQDVRLF